MERILLTGVTGQVGYELWQSLQSFGDVLPTIASHEEGFKGEAIVMDLADPDSISKVVRKYRPTLIVNPAAYTAVDKAEAESDLAMKINGVAPGVLAEEAKKLDAGLIHFSTDYVYPGEGLDPFTENTKTGPLNFYGKSKLAGDEAITATGASHLILRTSWVYGVFGKNFVKTMLNLGKSRETLSVIDDQIGAPTNARALSDITGMIITKGENNLRSYLRDHGGIVHVVNSGETSWFDFAKEIYNLASSWGYEHNVKEINPISTSSYPTPAMRPKNSRLSIKKLDEMYSLKPPHWKKSLEMSFPFLMRNL